MFARLRRWWHSFVARHIVADDPFDDERLRWQERNRRDEH